MGPSAGLTHLEEIAVRAEQDRIQAQDAEARVVVWDAEKAVDGDLDAECEDDPDYVVDKSVNDSGIGMMGALLGIRSEDGVVVPINTAKVGAASSTGTVDGSRATGPIVLNTDDIEEAQYVGTSEDVPLNAGALVHLFFINSIMKLTTLEQRLTHLIVDHHLTQTQELLEPTQHLPLDTHTSSTMQAITSSLPPSSDRGTPTPTQSQSMLQGETVPTQMLMDMLLDNQNSSAPTQDTEMLGTSFEPLP